MKSYKRRRGVPEVGDLCFCPWDKRLGKERIEFFYWVTFSNELLQEKDIWK